MRTCGSSRPQSSGTGSGRSRYCVSTAPTEPTTGAVGAVMCPSQASATYIVHSFSRKSESLREQGRVRTMATIDNGVNVEALLEARGVLQGAPEAAQFTWKASSKWQNGVHSQTTINNFFGLGEEHTHKSEAVFDADHPEV